MNTQKRCSKLLVDGLRRVYVSIVAVLEQLCSSYMYPKVPKTTRNNAPEDHIAIYPNPHTLIKLIPLTRLAWPPKHSFTPYQLISLTYSSLRNTFNFALSLHRVSSASHFFLVGELSDFALVCLYSTRYSSFDFYTSHWCPMSTIPTNCCWLSIFDTAPGDTIFWFSDQIDITQKSTFWKIWLSDYF